MTEQPQTIRVQMSAWLEYRVDNPAAPSDASAFTAEELDPEGKSHLRSVPTEAYRVPTTALIIELAKRSAAEGLRIPHPAIPGATFLQAGSTQFNIVPPDQTGVTPPQ